MFSNIAPAGRQPAAGSCQSEDRHREGGLGRMLTTWCLMAQSAKRLPHSLVAFSSLWNTGWGLRVCRRRWLETHGQHSCSILLQYQPINWWLSDKNIISFLKEGNFPSSQTAVSRDLREINTSILTFVWFNNTIVSSEVQESVRTWTLSVPWCRHLNCT